MNRDAIGGRSFDEGLHAFECRLSIMLQAMV